MWSSVADGRRLNPQQLHLMGGPSSASGIRAAVSRSRGRYEVGCGREVIVRTMLFRKSVVPASVAGDVSVVGPVLLLMSWFQLDLGDKRCVQSNCGSVELGDRCLGHPCFAVGTSFCIDGPK